MRRGVSSIVAALCMTVILAALFSQTAQAAAAGGIRIAPAAVRLELAKGTSETTADISVANTYTVPVTLRFAIERAAQNVSHMGDPTALISLTSAEITVTAGGSATQTLTLRDSRQLSPGSQVAELVITQLTAGSGAGVGVQPAVRLPITIIKDEGAIMSLGLTNIASSSFMMRQPQTVNVMIRNTGNVIAIPHGLVTVRGPRGTLVGQGTINTASAALLPGTEKSLPVAITPMDQASLPGTYQISATYGLGGDSATQTARKSFFYIAWWHVVETLSVAGALVLLAYNLRRFIQYLQAHRKKSTPVPEPPARAKRRILVGRNA